MDSANEVPELPVETEYVRKLSVTSNKSDEVSSGLAVSENIFPKMHISADVAAKPTENAHLSVISELIDDSTIKRNDSYSKFGHLEIVSLDVAEQEQQPSVPTSEVLAFVGTDETNKQEQAKRSQEVSSGTQSSAISLSDYFSSNGSAKKSVNDNTVQFFNVIANSTTAEQVPSMKEQAAISSRTEAAGSIMKDSSLLNKEGTTEQPPLLKFFAEDKSGTDRTGKEFFDKIANETSHKPLNGISSAPATSQPASNVTINENVLSSTISHLEKVPFLVPAVSLANEEMYEAWIPSHNIRRILVASVTSAPGTFIPDKSQLTQPSIIIEEEMEDPIKLLLLEINSSMAQQRKVLTANDVIQSEEGLKKLMDSECYYAAINLTGRLLNGLKKSAADGNIKHSPYSLKLWFIRIALFVKLRKFSYAEVESEAFGDFDKPDLYYEYYPDLYHGKKGSLVPFSFRLLLAELPQYQGNHQTALNNLYRVLHVVQQIIKNLDSGCAEDGSMVELSEARRKASIDLWHQREHKVLYSVLNCFLSQRDYIMSVSIIRILLDKDKKHTTQLYSALGRIYLQLGDMKQAQHCFNLATHAAEKVQDKNLEVEKLINKALLSITHNENEEAFKFYEQAVGLQPDNPMLVNNMAVCLLYMGRLKESLSLLERTIQKNPQSCLHDGILFNICTLYELESSHCTMKKHAMLNLVSKYAGDNFMVSCLKIPPNSRV